MKTLSHLTCALLLAALLAPSVPAAYADPCGMVPPVYTGEGPPIVRVGLQKTYVFWRDGVETYVIRPGFTGKVENFGMLIPFPEPPAMRKVDDAIFQHIAAAIDPPEMVLNLNPYPTLGFNSSIGLGGNVGGGGGPGKGLAVNETVILKEEAIGMYEVVVLAAGSSAALKKWMDDHKYVFPTGMDAACDDYIQAGWCFVAVKTRVSGKKQVDPRAGMTDVNPGIPAGGFDGNIQAMGFRFRAPELVVPMRLSSFNAGELHNVVYLLTDKPSAIKDMPNAMVRRQLSGEELYRNVTSPLPLRIIGLPDDKLEDDSPVHARIKALAAQRDPAPHNGLARELFAFDLLAAVTGQLAHPHEEVEKDLLNIAERLDLRGPEIDRVNHAELADMRKAAGEDALKLLKGMTLTVIDGDFPRDVLARDNIHFIRYSMPAEENTTMSYNAVNVLAADTAPSTPSSDPASPVVRPRTPTAPGIVLHDATPVLPGLKFARPTPAGTADNGPGDTGSPASANTTQNIVAAIATGIGATFIATLAVLLLRRRRASGAAAMLLGLIATFGFALQAAALAQDGNDAAEIEGLIDQLADRATAQAALDKLVAKGEKAADFLLGEAEEGQDAVKRGWSIVALGEIGGKAAEDRLTLLYQNEKQSMLIRTWAAAAVVKMKRTLDELTGMANEIQRFPALGRPIGMRIVGMISGDMEGSSVEKLLQASMRIPQLQSALARPIMAMGPKPLVEVMQKGTDNNVRRQAAGYLAALGNQGGDDQKDTAAAVIAAYDFDADAKQAPWSGGALWLPGMQWQKEQALGLIRNLLQWHLWLDRNNQQAEQRQIDNNLRSIGLIRVAGMNWPQQQGTVGWLTSYAAVAGKDDVRKMLEAQGAVDDPKYKAVIE